MRSQPKFTVHAQRQAFHFFLFFSYRLYGFMLSMSRRVTLRFNLAFVYQFGFPQATLNSLVHILFEEKC